MNDKKITISRSFAKKLNLGNYETADFFSSRSMELPSDTSIIEQQEISEELFSLAQIDTERDADMYIRDREGGKGVSVESFIKIIDEVSIGNPFAFDDFENLADWQHKIVQSVKRAYQRSPLKKSKDKPNERSTANLKTAYEGMSEIIEGDNS
jgi:hypothetical protein